MWQRHIFEIPIILIFLLVSVTGSCLEYGHSCWGAHGKRSGVSLIRAASNLNNAELSLGSNIADNHPGAREKTFFENLQDIEQTLEKTDENEIDTHGKQLDQAFKLRRLLRKHRPDLMNRHSIRIDSSAELTNQLNGNQPMTERWHRVPLLKMKKYAKHGSAADINESEQQAEKKSLSRNDEDEVYFDYK